MNIVSVLMHITATIITTTVHEWGHALVALKCGDISVRQFVTFDPRINVNCKLIAIIEFIKSIGIRPPMVAFGYVQYNPQNFRKKWDILWVALAGPFAEFGLYILSEISYTILSESIYNIPIIILNFIRIMQAKSIISIIFNLLPLPSLDGFVVVKLFWPQFAEKISLLPYLAILVPTFGTFLLEQIIQIIY